MELIYLFRLIRPVFTAQQSSRPIILKSSDDGASHSVSLFLWT
jgi:hypothetical protein